jgi:two-component system, cell cycle sensor histidine kinase and response regulator CckA
MHVLLVDDEELIRHSGKALLGVLGHQVDLASSGAEALLKLESTVYDAVLLDLTMPDMSGKDVLAQLRQKHPQLPVAICSGYLVDQESLMSAGAPRPPTILYKPYSVQELIDFLDVSTRRVE